MSLPAQPDKPDFGFRPPLFTFDNLKNNVLDRTIFSRLAIIGIPVLAFWLDQRNAGIPLDQLSAPTLSQLRNVLFTVYPWAGRIWLFTLFKHVNKALVRYVRNLGSWRADKPDWAKEVVVITGGSGGIGKATVEALSHRKHAKIAVLDFSPPQYAKAPPGAPEILYFKTDVSDPKQVKAAADEIRRVHGEPTILMNCAGIANGSLIIEAELESIHRVWKVNTLANWVTAQEFLPHMIKHNHGHILTVASSGSFMSLPQMSEYSTSKAAALTFHEVLGSELMTRYNAPRVRTSIACPTKVRTALGDGMEDHSSPFFTPNLMPIQVADRIVAAFDSGLSHFIVQPELMRILPWMRAVPDWIRRIVNIIGETDNQVNDEGILRAFYNGYGAGWTGEAQASRQRALQRILKRKEEKEAKKTK